MRSQFFFRSGLILALFALVTCEMPVPEAPGIGDLAVYSYNARVIARPVTDGESFFALTLDYDQVQLLRFDSLGSRLWAYPIKKINPADTVGMLIGYELVILNNGNCLVAEYTKDTSWNTSNAYVLDYYNVTPDGALFSHAIDSLQPESSVSYTAGLMPAGDDGYSGFSFAPGVASKLVTRNYNRFCKPVSDVVSFFPESRFLTDVYRLGSGQLLVLTFKGVFLGKSFFAKINPDGSFVFEQELDYFISSFPVIFERTASNVVTAFTISESAESGYLFMDLNHTTGETDWEKQLINNQDNEQVYFSPSHLMPTPDKGYILTGTRNNHEQVANWIMPFDNDKYEVMIYKADANGQIQWAKSYRQPYSIGACVLPLSDSYTVMGISRGIVEEDTYIFFLKADSFGNLIATVLK